jgi:predicted enzyme related to lactoylglutathione lyase
MDVFKTHGAFSWAELMTSDPAAALAFYGRLFGWSAKDMAMPNGTYTTFQVSDTSVGGMMKIPAAAAGMPPAWGVYVTVRNVDETVEQVESLGGKVVMPPRDVPGVGRMAVIQDPQGASLSVITYTNNNASG